MGVDDPAPRRLLEGAGFDLIVDAGLGGGPRNYLDILIHSFPSGVEASECLGCTCRAVHKFVR